MIPDEGDKEFGEGRPVLTDTDTLPPMFRTSPGATGTPRRTGDVTNRMVVRVLLDDRCQYRPASNVARNGGRRQ